jgi:DNA-binding response OmpR family regulator
MAYKVLVVDDERTTVELLKLKLLDAKYEVVTALNGREGLEKVASDNPDIILLDLMMPEMNGFDVLKEIREKYKDKWRPVVILSSRNELESVIDCYTMDADLYMSKPVNIMEVLANLKKITDLLVLRDSIRADREG